MHDIVYNEIKHRRVMKETDIKIFFLVFHMFKAYERNVMSRTFVVNTPYYYNKYLFYRETFFSPVQTHHLVVT